MTEAVKIEPAKVKSYVDRVESLEKEKQAIGDDVRDVYDEAKKAGLNTKALRKIVAKRRAKKPDPQVEAAMHAYELALDEAAAMVSNGDTSLREATAKTGFSKSAIQRRVSQRKQDTASGTETAHDAATGEIIESTSAPQATSQPGTPTTADPVTPTIAGGGDGGTSSHVTGGDDGAECTPLKPEPNVSSAGGAEAPAPSLYQRITGAFHDPHAALDEAEATWNRVRGVA